MSVPGADDNGSAVALLLSAARILFGLSSSVRPIWLVHITGEEFPGDDLGCRRILSTLLANRKDIFGLLVSDMIAWRNGSDPIFQINAGYLNSSLSLAACALNATDLQQSALSTPLTAAFRGRFSQYSYLYNTDGIIADSMGYPVILFNEHINRFENFERPYYHQSSDTVAHIDALYGSSISRVVIETAAQLAASTASSL